MRIEYIGKNPNDMNIFTLKKIERIQKKFVINNA